MREVVPEPERVQVIRSAVKAVQPSPGSKAAGEISTEYLFTVRTQNHTVRANRLSSLARASYNIVNKETGRIKPAEQ